MSERSHRTALLSAYDRKGLVEFARLLERREFEIISTGGTAQELRDSGVSVTEVADVTGAREILDGRVKTLHPHVHGGLLALRDSESHMDELSRLGIRTIDVVVNNLYPFVTTIGDPDVPLSDALENIDIGGPAMTRAAAKNFPHVVVITDPDDYERIGTMIDQGDVSFVERRRLATKAFQHVAAYDTAIASYLRSDAATDMPSEITFGYQLVARPRYGENPHQPAGVYAFPAETGGVVNAEQLHGIDMSYLNYFDSDAAWSVASAFDCFGTHAAVIVKHANPCGLAVRESQPEAWEAALAGDPVSAFGGIVGFNSTLTKETASAMEGVLLDVIVAPSYEDEAIEILKKRRRTRVLRVDPVAGEALEVRSVLGGALVQSRDGVSNEDFEHLRVVTERVPTNSEMEDLKFAWSACRFVRSNAIVLAKNNTLVGMGAGQPNRVTSVHLSARAAGDDAEGAVMASDAFIPFPDTVEEGAKSGVTAVIQPGGSLRDEEVIAAANNLGLAMVFVGRRHFYH